MNKEAVAKELVAVAELVAGEVSRKSLMDGIYRFEPVLATLKELMNQHEEHWSYGTAPDEVLEEMLEMSSDIHTQAEKLARELKNKMTEWRKKAEKRV